MYVLDAYSWVLRRCMLTVVLIEKYETIDYPVARNRSAEEGKEVGVLASPYKGQVSLCQD